MGSASSPAPAEKEVRFAAAKRRYLSLWLRRLAIDRALRESPRPADQPSRLPPNGARPFALVGAVKNARRLVAVNDAAAAAGLREGMSFADALAIHPSLSWAEASPEKDARLLGAIADWCERFSPLVGLHPPDGVILDISGAAHLFGGEAALARDLVARLAAQGLHACVGIASTVGAAWAAARYGKAKIILPGEEAKAMAPLGVAALRLAPEIENGLAKLGLPCVGDLMTRPRAPLAARFGAELIRRLDQALGREEEPITPRAPLPALSVEQRFAEPLFDDGDLLASLERLLERLCPLLERRGEGARRMLASFFAADGKVCRLEIGTSRPLRDPDLLYRLYKDKFSLARWENEFGFDCIRVAVLEVESLSPTQIDLAEDEDGPSIPHLIDRLAVRLGSSRVLRLILQDTHVPEHASVAIPALSAGEFAKSPSTGRTGAGERETDRSSGLGQDSLALPRPLRLFERAEPIEAIAEIPDGPPARFRWRQVVHDVARAEGPERILLPWWRDGENRALARDYFRVETAQGARFWLYREGAYGGEKHPRWFLHGILP